MKSIKFSLHGVGILSKSYMHIRGLVSSLKDICTEFSKCRTCNSDSDLIINEHCSGESASCVDEFVNNFQFLSIHTDSLFLYGFPGAGWCTTCFVMLIVTS